MASEVDICNLALANLGDTATVSSINPPDASAQAQHCARFYPAARNAMLELYNWNFAVKRIALAEVANPSTTWLYAYAAPAGEVNMISVLPADALDDYVASYPPPDSTDYPPSYVPAQTPLQIQTQPYTVEIDGNGNTIILTNVPNAVLRYSIIVTDASKFSPLFVVALGWLLASMLAGPLIKGDMGAAQAQRCLSMWKVFESEAEASDAGHGKINVQPVTPWMAGR